MYGPAAPLRALPGPSRFHWGPLLWGGSSSYYDFSHCSGNVVEFAESSGRLRSSGTDFAGCSAAGLVLDANSTAGRDACACCAETALVRDDATGECVNGIDCVGSWSTCGADCRNKIF